MSDEGKTWTSEIAVCADPEHVLDTLTDVDACSAWSPVGFHVDEMASPRLRARTTTHVSGRLAGRRVRFRVDVLCADAEGLVLSAVGPVELCARYVVRRSRRGSHVAAAISVRRRGGARGGLAAGATSVLLAAGALDLALARIAREAEQRHSRSLAGRAAA